jgi:hypothetical protein
MAAVAERAPSVREQNIAPFFRRFIQAIEPWYDWGRTNTFRLDAKCPKFSDEAEGEVCFFEVQWLGLHFAVQIGRTPPKRYPRLVGQGEIAKRIIALRDKRGFALGGVE